MKKRFVAFLLVLIMVLGMLPVSAMAASNSTVVLHPSVNRTVTGVKVKVGDTISGHKVSEISGYDITVDLGKYNVNNGTFNLPYAKDIWEGVDNNKVDYISWAGSGSSSRSEGGNALLANGKNTAYYYFKGATPTYNDPQVNCYVLYIDDSINPLGYKYNLWQKKSFTCALHGANCPDSDGSHAITVASIKAASQKLLAANVLEEGYELVGWTKKAEYAPDIKSFDASGNVILSTKTNDDIFFVAKKPTPTKYTYHLIHEFNYEGGTRWDITATTAAESYELDVNKGIPTRDGYTFLGWADEADATAAQYHGGDLIPLTKDHPIKTIYAVWEENTPPTDKPDKPGEGNFEKAGLVSVACSTKPDDHAKETYDLKKDTFTIGEVEGNATDGYTCEINVTADSYVSSYVDTHGAHTLTGDNTKKFTLTWVTDKWVAKEGGVTFYVECDQTETPVEPKAPTAEELKKLEMAVQVKCVVDDSQQHKDAYDLLGEYNKDYFVGEPRKDEDDWLCDISYLPDLYVAEFNTTFQNLKHVQNDEQIVPVTLIWAGDSWQIKTQGRVHVTEVYNVTYTDGVENEEVFADQVYSDLRKDSTTPAFNGTPTRTGYTFAGWEPEVAETVTQTVIYVAMWTPVEPKAPTADELKELDMAVQVKCVVDDSQQHTEAYGLLGEYDEDYFVGEPRKDGDDWLCDISYYPERYVAAFNTTFQNLKHVQNDEKIVPVTLIWDGGSWQLKTQGRVHVTEEYTVTFNAYGGFPTPDEQHVKSGEKAVLPVEPTLKGYTFAFWYLGEDEQNATAYDFNTPVTENITLTAKWEAKKANVHLMIFKSGDLSTPIVNVPYATDKLAGDTIDLAEIDLSSYLDFDFEIDGGWYDDGLFNLYKKYVNGEQENKPAALTELQITGNWQNLKLIVTELVPVVYYMSDADRVADNRLFATTARVGSALPTANAPTATREGYTFTFWSREGQLGTDVTGQTVNGWTNLVANWKVTPHNIYAYARLNSYVAPLTTNEFDTPVTLNEATLSRLGLGS